MNNPAPPVPAECDLSDFSYMPLDVRRLRDSKIAAAASGEEFRAAVLLWCVAWHQKPAASVPNDDQELAQLAGYGRDMKGWKKVRAGALRGWVLCSDGRWYHPVVAEKALEAWNKKLFQRDRSRRGNDARWSKRAPDVAEASQKDDARDPSGNTENIPEGILEGVLEGQPEPILEGSLKESLKESLNGPSKIPREKERRVIGREEIIPPLQSPPFAEVDRCFDRFWKAYPSRGDFPNPKKPARDRFHKLVESGVDPEAIIAGVERYAKRCRAQRIAGGQTVAQAMTYLNQKRWEDDDPPPAALREVIEQEYGRAWL